MKINDYIGIATNPFVETIDESYFVKSTSFQTQLVKHIKTLYGRLNLRPFLVLDDEDLETQKTDEEIIEEIKYICEDIYATNKYKYTRLYDTTTLDYNPIENYNMTESGSDGTSGTVTKSSEQGSQTVSENNGITSSSSGTDTNKSTAYDDTSFADNSKTESTTSETNTETKSQTIGNRTDTDTTTDNTTVTHSLSRSGNIGVTTSQQMIESERNVALFNMYSIVAQDIVKTIALMLY